jgi:hypothetical protein
MTIFPFFAKNGVRAGRISRVGRNTVHNGEQTILSSGTPSSEGPAFARKGKEGRAGTGMARSLTSLWKKWSYRERYAKHILRGEVELNEGREQHIGDHPPEPLPKIRERSRATVAEPHEIRRNARSPSARLFLR